MNEEDNKRENVTFSQIKETLKKVGDILKNNNLDIYIAGGIVPYLLLNQDSNRLHDDIDTICSLENIEKIREVFKKEGLYIPEWDSKNYSKDGKDYGFEMKINGIPFGIYPFEYRDGIFEQYSFDPYNKKCKIKEFPVKQISDYICAYESKNGETYNTMGLEYIMMSKKRTGRPKDEKDFKKIYEYGNLRENLINEIQQIYNEKDLKEKQLITTGNANKFLKLFSKLKNKLKNTKKQIKAVLGKNNVIMEERRSEDKKKEFLKRINAENNEPPKVIPTKQNSKEHKFR